MASFESKILTDHSYEGIMNEVLPLVRKAGEIAIRMWQTSRNESTFKTDGSPVTSADIAIEKLLRNGINRLYPYDGIMGEEGSFIKTRSGRVWNIDPIDGTIQFMRGQDFWAILLALDDFRVGRVGIISFPARNELIYASRNNGCWEENRNGRSKLQVSGVSDLSEGYVLHNGLSFAQQANKVENLKNIVTRAYAERGYADAFGHAEVIRGNSDVMIDFLTEYHDIAAIRVAVIEAGGKWSSLDGTQDLSSKGSITSNGILHAEALSYFA